MAATSESDSEESSNSTDQLSNIELIQDSGYIMIKKIGQGAVGQVFLVKKDGVPYAMKILNKAEMIHHHKIKRVLIERDILVRSDFPFIVKLYDSFRTEDDIRFVMEYCVGGCLYRYLSKQPNRILSENAARFYTAEIILALEYLHACGFIYRDLKPENVLIHESGHIKLTDFDLCKCDNHSKDEPSTSDSDSLEPKFVTYSYVGTEGYLAPEVITHEGYTGVVDWWTVGVFIYEMLFGHLPFGPGGNYKYSFKSKNKISKDAKSIIRHLLQKDPHHRLGHENGAEDLKHHHWFKSINFSLILNQTPPFIPKVRSPIDTRYFPKYT
jgi:protein-serine/threonine kinase